MSLKKYCFCYDFDVGVTILGFLQMNAMIFFWARFSTLAPIYMWLDLPVALCYTVRSAFFLVDLAMDSSLQSREDYFLVHQITTYIISALAVAICTLEWVEWAYVPTWIIVGWVCCILMNVYHWFSLKAYVEVAQNADSDSNDGIILNRVPTKTSELSIFEGFNVNKME